MSYLLSITLESQTVDENSSTRDDIGKESATRLLLAHGWK